MPRSRPSRGSRLMTAAAQLFSEAEMPAAASGRKPATKKAPAKREPKAPEHLISRPCQRRACDKCGQVILVAIWSGVTVHADPAPLGIHAEIAARLQGRRAYDVIPHGGRRAYLEFRDIHRVQLPRRHAVIASHACPSGRRPAIGWEIPARRPAAPQPTAPRILASTPVPF